MIVEPSIVVAMIGLLTAPFAAWVSWILSKRKTDNDIGTSIVVASADAVEAIRSVMDSLKLELAEAKKELTEFKAHNKELELSLKVLQAQNETLLEQNLLLANEIALLKNQVDRFPSVHELPQRDN
jgi:predicted nuclease with TOPRIM domain